ncbi:MAG: anti-sigma factor family protein [Leptodesmis sp.]|uniref:anti-sigma factor family protein n=1 Tax=Leptodesmis sp. TaxID=3100501 RepID=UPI003D125303
MTSNFDPPNFNPQAAMSGNLSSSPRALDVMHRDRFELLSAYMDGEVTADERRQVEDWLSNDPTVQRLYERLLKLRQSLQAMPVPISDECSVERTVDSVLARVDRRPRHAVIWGGIAIAAVVVGAVSSVFLGDHAPAPQLAQAPQETQQPAKDSAEPLLVALDKPLISIPASSASPQPGVGDAFNPSNSTIR